MEFDPEYPNEKAVEYRDQFVAGMMEVKAGVPNSRLLSEGITVGIRRGWEARNAGIRLGQAVLRFVDMDENRRREVRNVDAYLLAMMEKSKGEK